MISTFFDHKGNFTDHNTVGGNGVVLGGKQWQDCVFGVHDLSHPQVPVHAMATAN